LGNLPIDLLVVADVLLVAVTGFQQVATEPYSKRDLTSEKYNVVKHFSERNSLQDLNKNPRSFNDAATTELICTSKTSLESNLICTEVLGGFDKL
jgi:hypothetical protein